MRPPKPAAASTSSARSWASLPVTPGRSIASTDSFASRNASHAAVGSDAAKDKAKEGAYVVRQVVGAIQAVQEQAVTLKGNMDALGQQAQGIGHGETADHIVVFLAHGIAPLVRWLHDVELSWGGLLGSLTASLTNLLIGFAAGALVLGVVSLIQKMRGDKGNTTYAA